MADIVSQFTQAKIEYMFVDGDTRMQTLKNPDSTKLTQQNIAELNAFIQANNLLVGDQANSTFGKIKRVSTITGTTTKLDLDS